MWTCFGTSGATARRRKGAERRGKAWKRIGRGKHSRRMTGLRQSGTPNWEAWSAEQYQGKRRAARSECPVPRVSEPPLHPVAMPSRCRLPYRPIQRTSPARRPSRSQCRPLPLAPPPALPRFAHSFIHTTTDADQRTGTRHPVADDRLPGLLSEC